MHLTHHAFTLNIPSPTTWKRYLEFIYVNSPHVYSRFIAEWNFVVAAAYRMRNWGYSWLCL